MKPNQEKKKTRPYLLKGLRTGTVRAFLLIGLTGGSITMAWKMPIVRDDISRYLKLESVKASNAFVVEQKQALAGVEKGLVLKN